MARPDYGRARWYGANGGNYSNANRESSHNINKIVIHITQGSFSSAVNWFNDSRAGVSAHYTVRSKDGFIGQSVQEEDIAHHAGNWSVNQSSIGIEHEGYGNDPSWLTKDLYHSSAKLSAYLARKYDIPIDRNHFLGHKQVSSTACPGNYWDWDRYMRLVRSYAGNRKRKAYKQMVDNASPRFRALKRFWGVSTYSSQKVGKNYRYANPAPRAGRPNARNGAALWKIRIPRKGRYDVFARWPANSGYNHRAVFWILTVNGWRRRAVNQRRNGGRWVKLGTFTMRKGDRYAVRLHRRTRGKGYLIADAVFVREAK